jgi:hypothetical protein
VAAARNLSADAAAQAQAQASASTSGSGSLSDGAEDAAVEAFFAECRFRCRAHPECTHVLFSNTECRLRVKKDERFAEDCGVHASADESTSASTTPRFTLHAVHRANSSTVFPRAVADHAFDYGRLPVKFVGHLICGSPF